MMLWQSNYLFFIIIIHQDRSTIDSLFLFIGLDLSFNQLSSLPDEIADLQLLASLNVSHNKLSSVPDSFSLIESLIELDVSYNQISEHFELASLEVLKASNNLLTSLPISLSSSSIKEIDVSSNQIVSLGMKEDDLIMLLSLQVVDLRNNPLLDDLHYFFSSITSIKIFLDAK